MSMVRLQAAVLFLILCLAGPALGQASNPPPGDRRPPMDRPPPVDRPPPAETMPLAQLLEIAERNTGKTYLVDHRAQPVVVIAQLDTDDLDYGRLLLILQNNDLAAVTVDGIVNVVPVGVVRQLPLPTIVAEDDSIDDEEWVTWMVQTKSPPDTVIPILRPLMPSAGHLAAHPPTGSVLIVDRYGNAKRIVALIRELDGN